MDESAVLRACGRYRLERDSRRVVGELGAVSGPRAGASVDFHDHRAYYPGDDPRRIDWARYGKSEQLSVRVYRQEVHPSIDIVLDVSRSMAIPDGRKSELSRELAAFAWHSGRLQGSAARLYLAGDTLVRSEQPALARQDATACALFSDAAGCSRALRSGTLQIVISDCLGPHEPRAALRELCAGAGQVVVLMTLGPWEADPDPSALGAAMLTERESGRELPTRIDPGTLQRYRERLARLRQDLRQGCEALGVRLLPLICDADLLDVLRRDLLPAGLVRPA